MLVNLAGGSFWSYWGKILAGASKVLIGVNLVQLAQPFDRDTRSSSSLESLLNRSYYFATNVPYLAPDVPYFASVMLIACSHLLCSKFCGQNSAGPSNIVLVHMLIPRCPSSAVPEGVYSLLKKLFLDIDKMLS